MDNRTSNIFPILYSTLSAVLLSLLPGADWWWMLWPDFVLLVLAYWTMATALDKFRWAVLFGLIQDTLHNTIYGTHVLVYSLVMYFCLYQYRQLRQYNRWQQSLTVGILLLFAILAKWLMVYLQHGQHLHFAVLGSVLTGMLTWPVIFAILRLLRRRYGVV